MNPAGTITYRPCSNCGEIIRTSDPHCWLCQSSEPMEEVGVEKTELERRLVDRRVLPGEPSGAARRSSKRALDAGALLTVPLIITLSVVVGAVVARGIGFVALVLIGLPILVLMGRRDSVTSGGCLVELINLVVLSALGLGCTIFLLLHICEGLVKSINN